MKIIVSGKRKELTDGLTVAQLIGSETSVRPRYVSIVTRKEILLDGGRTDHSRRSDKRFEINESAECFKKHPAVLRLCIASKSYFIMSPSKRFFINDYKYDAIGLPRTYNR